MIISAFVRWKGWLIPDFFREMSPHTHVYCRRNGLTRTSCTSKGSAKSCNWGETILGTITHAGNHPARKQLCKTMTWGARIFPELPSDRTSGNGHRPKHRSCYLNIRKHFVTVRVMQHWQRLLRQVVESPPLEIKKCLDVVPDKQFCVVLLEQGGLGQMTSRDPCQLHPSCDHAMDVSDFNLAENKGACLFTRVRTSVQVLSLNNQIWKC